METPLSTAGQTLYQTLRVLAKGNNVCSVSYNILTKKSGYCKTTVIHAIKELSWQQWIRKHTYNDERTGHQINRYELLK